MAITKTARILALGSMLMLGNTAAFSENKALLDTLLQNGSITPTQYENLTKPKAPSSSADKELGLNEVLLQNGVINKAQYDALSGQKVVKAEQGTVQQDAVKKGDDVIVKLDSKGFRVETADKAFKFKMGGRIQADVNFSANGQDFDPAPTEGFELRRARLYAAGTVWTDFDYKAQFDFAGNKVRIKDLFVKYTGFDWLDLTVGNQKQTISLELQESSNDIMFTERSLVYSLTAPLFDRALGVRASSSGKNWSAQFGGYGSSINTSQTGRWGVTSRVTGAPILSKTHLLHLGANVGYRNLNDGGVRFRYETTNLSSEYFTDTMTSIVNVDGATLAGFDAAYMLGPFSVQGEYAHTWLSRNNDLSGLDFGAYYVQAAWTLTGESRSYKASHGKFKRLQPNNPFSWKKGTWGAWELAARIDGNDLNSGDIVGGEETALTLATNWYLNRNIRLMADYRYAFDIQDSAVLRYGDSAETGIHQFTLRTQLTF
ncbi:OprO/OprP family phosphate-selective porin [Methyloprofundus sp.]|uniref:OprO/OprP family phosphate-selective porin n=1 Tax=Methyloprofundus sp. TaxID=2020875 RepID=UPI003D151A1E